MPFKNVQLDEKQEESSDKVSRCASCGRFGETLKFNAEAITSQFITKDGKKFAEHRRVAAVVQPLDGKGLCSICLSSVRNAHEHADEPPCSCPRCGFGPLEASSYDRNGLAWFECTRPGCHYRFSALAIQDQPPYTAPAKATPAAETDNEIDKQPNKTRQREKQKSNP